MPSPRETILRARFDDATRAMLLDIYDSIWNSSHNPSELTGYRIAGRIIEIARAGQRSRDAIEKYAAYEVLDARAAA
jgi:hypothetical protein